MILEQWKLILVMLDFGVIKIKPRVCIRGLTPLVAEDVAEAVVFCATRPPHANIAEIIIMPTQQASALVFHRKEN